MESLTLAQCPPGTAEQAYPSHARPTDWELRSPTMGAKAQLKHSAITGECEGVGPAVLGGTAGMQCEHAGPPEAPDLGLPGAMDWTWDAWIEVVGLAVLIPAIYAYPAREALAGGARSHASCG
jgi:hypothetical protein